MAYVTPQNHFQWSKPFFRFFAGECHRRAGIYFHRFLQAGKDMAHERLSCRSVPHGCPFSSEEAIQVATPGRPAFFNVLGVTAGTVIAPASVVRRRFHAMPRLGQARRYAAGWPAAAGGGQRRAMRPHARGLLASRVLHYRQRYNDIEPITNPSESKALKSGNAARTENARPAVVTLQTRRETQDK